MLTMLTITTTDTPGSRQDLLPDAEAGLGTVGIRRHRYRRRARSGCGCCIGSSRPPSSGGIPHGRGGPNFCIVILELEDAGPHPAGLGAELRLLIERLHILLILLGRTNSQGGSIGAHGGSFVASASAAAAGRDVLVERRRQILPQPEGGGEVVRIVVARAVREGLPDLVGQHGGVGGIVVALLVAVHRADVYF